jgi:hypothetical protein
LGGLGVWRLGFEVMGIWLWGLGIGFGV